MGISFSFVLFSTRRKDASLHPSVQGMGRIMREPLGSPDGKNSHIGSLIQPYIGYVFYLSSPNVFLSLYRFNEIHFPLGAILMAGRWAVLYGVAPETNGNGPGSSGSSSVPKVLGTGTPLS